MLLVFNSAVCLTWWSLLVSALALASLFGHLFGEPDRGDGVEASHGGRHNGRGDNGHNHNNGHHHSKLHTDPYMVMFPWCVPNPSLQLGPSPLPPDPLLSLFHPLLTRAWLWPGYFS